jgi:adenosylhomocysteine nucleosidase
MQTIKDLIRNQKLQLAILTGLLIMTACRKEADAPVCVLGAFEEEISLLEEKLEEKEVNDLAGLRVLKGRISGKEVVIAFTGIGKVNAAMTTTLMLEYFEPSAVIFTGIAGAINPRLNPADLVISERCAHHDLNYVYDDTLISYQASNPVNKETNPVFFYADSSLLELCRELSEEIQFNPVILPTDTLYPRIVFGTIVTGDSFIASGKKNRELMRRFEADAVEMEGAAVAQICYQRGIPFIIIRSISDSADEDAGTDIETFYRTSARNANLMVLDLLQKMND